MSWADLEGLARPHPGRHQHLHRSAARGRHDDGLARPGPLRAAHPHLGSDRIAALCDWPSSLLLRPLRDPVRLFLERPCAEPVLTASSGGAASSGSGGAAAVGQTGAAQSGSARRPTSPSVTSRPRSSCMTSAASAVAASSASGRLAISGTLLR